MTVTEKERRDNIRKACELIDARIRYNIALQNELSNYSDEQLRNYFSSASTGVTTKWIRDEFITILINNDIKNLKRIKTYIETGLVDKNTQLLLTLQIYSWIKSEEILIQRKVKAKTQWDKRISNGEKLAPRSFEDIRGTNEYNTVTELHKICEQLLEPIAQELFSKYFSFNIGDQTPFVTMNVDELQKLINRHRVNFENIRKNALKLTGVFEESRKIFIEIIEKYISHIDTANSWLKNYNFLLQSNNHNNLMSNETLYRMIQEYYTIYDLKYEIEPLTKMCNEILAEQTSYVNKQKISQDAFIAQLAKEARIKQSDATKSAQLKKQADEQSATRQKAAFTAEQERIKAENEAEKKKVSETIAARHKEIEENRVKNEEKKLETRKLIVSEEKLKIKDDGGLQSKLQLSDETIKKHYQELIDILSPDMQEISFDKAVKFIERLGGTVTSSGGSHHKITFKGSLFSYINKDGVQFVSGLPRPHGGETSLRRHELNLLKDAIKSILPENWELKFKVNISTKPKP